MRAERRGEITARQAELDARDARLRAARAEGRAEAVGTVQANDATVVTEVDGGGVPEVRRRRRWF